VKSNAAYIEGTQGQSGAHFNGEGQGQHFTQDQYSQLIHMLQNVRVNQSEGSTGDASANAVTCAGKVFNKTPHKVKEPGYWIQVLLNICVLIQRSS